MGFWPHGNPQKRMEVFVFVWTWGCQTMPSGGRDTTTWMEQLSSRSSIWEPAIIRFHSQPKVATSPLLRPTKASVVTLVWILAQIQPVKFSTHDQWTASRHHRCIQHQWWCHCLWKDTRWSWQSTESCFPESCWHQPDPEQVNMFNKSPLSLDLFSPK